MKRRIALISVGVAVLALLATIFTGASASASTDEFVAQRSMTFDIKDQAGNPGVCNGDVWIGRTATGSVQGGTRLHCPGESQFLEAQIVVFERGHLQLSLDEYQQCVRCRGLTVAHSEQGDGPGWCVRGAGVRGVAHPAGAGTAFGQAVVCV